MKSFLSSIVMMGVALAIALPLVGQEKEKKKNKKGENQQIANVVKSAKDAGINEEQTKKVEALAEEYGKKIADLQAKLGPDVQKALAAARKKVAGDGVKGKQAKAAVEKEAKLTDEQKTLVGQIDSSIQEFRGKVSDLLTPEQRDKAGFNKKKKKAA